MDKTTAFIMPTTHWDREWVMSRGQYQVRLVNLMDTLFDILEHHSDYIFLMDGQTVMLEDYQLLCPERKGDLERYIKGGNLVVGPWYVLADLFLQDGESCIRNLLIGLEQADKTGGRQLHLGYVPDSFGSTAALPMILQGFDIPYATFGRGRPDWDDQLPHYEFWWDAPDGSRVLTASHGYANGLFLSYPKIRTDITTAPEQDPAAVLHHFLQSAAEQGKREATPNQYYSVGIDHMEPKASLPRFIEIINSQQQEYCLQYGTPEDYLRAVEKDAAALRCYAGEMRGTPTNKMGLAGTLSCRMRTKQWNEHCESLLQQGAEPLWAMLKALTQATYPKGILDKLWRTLLKNQTHDSICGCSLDQVDRDVVNRYEYIDVVAEYLIKDGLHALTAQINTRAKPAGLKDAVAITVVNPLGRRDGKTPVQGIVRVPRRFLFSDCTLLDLEGREIPVCVQHIAHKKKDLESVYMTNRQLADIPAKMAESSLDADQVYTMLSLDFIADDIPPTGYKTWWLKPGKGTQKTKNKVWLCHAGMENDLIRVVFHNNGTFDLTYKATGHTYKGLHILTDREDIGNLYEHHGFKKTDEITTQSCACVWSMTEAFPHRMVYETTFHWTLPACAENGQRSAKNLAVPVHTKVTLYGGLGRLEISTTIDNRCKDHCLRAVFPTGLQAAAADACGQFNVISRQATKDAAEWEDTPFQHFVDVTDGANGLCLMARGLPAYEAIAGDDGMQLHLTLLRATGCINNDNIGANHLTPEGQCLGGYTFEYALMPHKGDWRDGHCLGQAAAYAAPCLIEADLQHGGALPSEGAVVTLQDDRPDLTQLSCLKLAEDESGLILRAWNAGERRTLQAQANIACSETWLVNLKEKPKEQCDDGKINIPAKALTTMLFRL